MKQEYNKVESDLKAKIKKLEDVESAKYDLDRF
jgi:hypothetical protein